MIFLSVGFHVSAVHPTKLLCLDEDACSDFVNQLGKKLGQLRSLHAEHISEVLRRAQRGGHIRWHILETEQLVISSTFRDDCKDTYPVTVGLEGPGLGGTPDIPDETKLRKLVEALGEDLDELRNLMRSQVTKVLRALYEGGIVECFMVPPDQSSIVANPSVPSGNYNTNPIPLPTSDPTLSSPVQSSPQASMDFDLFINYNDSMEESMLLPPVDTIDAGACPPFPAATPAESVGSLPDLDGGASCHSTPSTHYIHSPPASESLYLPGPVNYLQETGVKHNPRMNHSYSFGNHLDREEAFPLERSVSPPLMPNGIGADSTFAVVMSPESVNISPGLDGGAFHHSTPTYANSLPAEELLTPPSSDVINRQSSISSQEEIILELLLKSCKFNDESKKSVNKQAQEVLDAERFLLTQDPRGVLLAFLDPDQWEINVSRDLHGLGLPREWKGIRGAVNCLRVLDAKRINRYSVLERFALIFFNYNLEDLCRNWQTHLPPSTKEGVQKTKILDLILSEYHDDPRIRKSQPDRRTKITGSYCRLARWWWQLVASLGFGILLVADDALMRTISKYTFNAAQIDALATLALNIRPGTIRVFQSLESDVESFMLGQTTDNLREAIVRTDILGQSALTNARNEDQQALARQRSENNWVVENTKYSAEKKMTEFLV